MGFAKVRDTGVGTGSAVATLDLSFGALPAAGNLIVVCISEYGNSTERTIASVGDNQGNGAYTKVGETAAFGDSASNASIWYKENIGNPSGTFTITITPVHSSNYIVAMAVEFSGGATASVLRDSGTNQATDTATDANVTTAGTAGLIDDLVIGTALCALSSTNVNWGAAATTGYTNIGQYPDFTDINSISVDYKTATANGAQTVNWSHDDTVGGTFGWGAVVAVFKVAAGGGGGGAAVSPYFFRRSRANAA